MAYFLGRDVKVWITTEDADTGIKSDGTACDAVDSAPGTDFFANERAAASTADTYALTDITGVDLGIGVTDEDVTYIGQRSVLKAEIKKETTVSLTRKKSSREWDIIFNGPTKTGESSSSPIDLKHGARWGCMSSKVSDGASAPKDHRDNSPTSGEYTFGYRVYIQLKDGTETIGVPMCQVTGHTVSINGDGTTEETMEFSSNVTPIIGTDANDCLTTVALADI